HQTRGSSHLAPTPHERFFEHHFPPPHHNLHQQTRNYPPPPPKAATNGQKKIPFESRPFEIHLPSPSGSPAPEKKNEQWSAPSRERCRRGVPRKINLRRRGRFPRRVE